MAKQKKKNNWGVVLGVIIFLFIMAYLFSALLSVFLSGDELKQGNVAKISVKGVIMTDNTEDFFGSSVADSTTIVADIEDAAANPMIEAILLEINSPGGAPVATDEIAQALERSNKTTVAWIREVGTSGGYWIASSADHIIANRMSITGSIGVIGSYLDFSGFLNDWNVSYERLVGGKYKDAGIPYRQLTAEERRLFQKKIDLLHQEFKDSVQKNRRLTNSQIENVAQGEFYLGSEAKNLNLIDQLGGEREAIEHIEKKLNITAEIVVYEHEPSLLEILSGLLNDRSFFFGKGLAEGMQQGRIGWVG